MTELELKAKVGKLADHMVEGHKTFPKTKNVYFRPSADFWDVELGMACAIGMACYSATRLKSSDAWEVLCTNLELPKYIKVDQPDPYADDPEAHRFLSLHDAITRNNDIFDCSPENIADWLKGLTVGIETETGNLIMVEETPCVLP
jgi:hypothetical protein